MSQGFYIASYPETPYRYEVGEINLRELMTINHDSSIVVHLYVEHVDAKSIVEKIMSWCKDLDMISIPGKTLINMPLNDLRTQALSHLRSSWWFW